MVHYPHEQLNISNKINAFVRDKLHVNIILAILLNRYLFPSQVYSNIETKFFVLLCFLFLWFFAAKSVTFVVRGRSRLWRPAEKNFGYG